MADSITFVVPGLDKSDDARAVRGAGAAPPLQGLPRGTIKRSVSVGVQRAAGAEVRVSAEPGKDVVVLHIAGGPALILHPETARDLMLAQGGQKRGAVEPTEVTVPAQLQWRGLEQAAATRGATRGFLGDVLLSAIEVITGTSRTDVAGFVVAKVVERFDQHVRPGVYALNPGSLFLPGQGGAPLERIAGADGSRLLVLLHGTFSDTNGTFGKLWTQHPQLVQGLFRHYGGQVYALEHQTLGVSPIGNALLLARALPRRARVHLVTHSRGGLVAEALVRCCAPGDQAGQDAARLFAGAANARQLQELKELAALVKDREIVVERVARVACPARGTLLASGRLDAYLSVFKWTLELAGVPVAPELVDFIGEVVQHRADPREMPGLAAVMPDSPFVQWLHAVDEAIPGELRVVAGDVQGDSVASWLKTLLSDSFYWTDNDFVVQTSSMYGGPPRAAGASFMLDQGGNVSHFNYFGNERTAEAIVNALVQDAPQGFRTIGPLSWSGESPTGVRAALRGPGDGRPLNEKPAVFVLPGILGSNLKADGKRIWLSWRLINGLTRLNYQYDLPDGIEPDGPISSVYDDLEQFLARTHEVIEFAFDWRRPIEQEAQRLARAVTAALDARDQTGQPVRILAHSMGGLLARAMQLEQPEVWRRMMLHPGARFLMLGTPNGGSWAPMQVLSGDDRFGNALVAFGAPFQDHKARKLMAAFPGFIQLQAGLLDANLRLDRSETWQKLADDDLALVRARNLWHRDELQLVEYIWGVPPQGVLDKAVALRRRLDRQLEDDIPGFKDKVLLVVGKSRFTPDGYELGEEGLAYLNAQESGDGRVTLQSALLPGVRTWSLDCEHGNLPDDESAFEGYRELLETGTTQLPPLKAEAPVARGAVISAALHVRSRPSRLHAQSRPPEAEREVLALAGREPLAAARPSGGTALRISVINGDLTFVREPLLIGHYRSEQLYGTEAVMNKLTGGVMQDALALGLYPDAPGSYQVFVNTRGNPDNPLRLPRPESVIVVGLGEEAKLRATDLVSSVRRATIAWAQRMVERQQDAVMEMEFALAATLIGSGGMSMNAGQAAQLIAQGVREANDRLEASSRERRATVDVDGGVAEYRPWPRVGHLQLVELYLDRAGEAWRALRVQAATAPGQFTVTDSIQTGAGALPRPLTTDYRGADYDLITALTQQQRRGDDAIVYTLDTRRARAEVRAQAMQGRLLRQFVESASNDRATDRQIGRTLFKLLVPVEMEPFLGGSSELLIELDSGTAGIPWELLDTLQEGGGDSRPWAIRSKLLRKLRTEQFRRQVADAGADAHILVVGEPQCDTARYPRLPGAREEAMSVAARLTGSGGIDGDRVTKLYSEVPDKFGPDTRAVIDALMSRDWRIVHISGHGEPPEMIGKPPVKEGDPPQQYGDPRGVVLSDGTFLGPREIESMRVVPELVFVNCCYLAARDAATVLRDDDGSGLGRPYNRASFASGVAEQLIRIGVRCVVAAGWAVEDKPAKDFATAFYDALLRGQRFMDAVAAAREAAYAPGSNTWAAYQCYGDPDWRLRREAGDAQRPRRSVVEEFREVASVRGLLLALETLAVQSRYQKAPSGEQQARIRHLEARFAARWGDVGEIAHAFGAAWSEAGDKVNAVAWYQRALAANDGGAPLKAAEQLGNLLVRLAWEKVDAARKQGAPSADLLQEARREIGAGFEFLDKLVNVQPSVERHSLCGSAWKRMAMIEGLAQREPEAIEAIANMRTHYQEAEKLARDGGHPEFFYPALNTLSAELALRAGATGGLDAARIAAVRQSLEARVRDDPDFWSVLGRTELELYEALAEGRLVAARPGIENGYAELHARIAAPRNWSLAYDQLAFVLPRYEKKAAEAEVQAARALRDFVEKLIQATPR